MSESDREFAFMLKAAFKKVFENDASITAELLQQEGLFAKEPVNKVRGLLGVCCTVLRQAGYEGELSDETLAKTKLTAAQQSVFSRFWAQQKGAAHGVLAEQSRFQDRLSSFEWRVDSKMVGDKQEPTAVVEMVIGADDKCHFELSGEQLQDMIATLSEVKTVLDEKSK